MRQGKVVSTFVWENCFPSESAAGDRSLGYLRPDGGTVARGWQVLYRVCGRQTTPHVRIFLANKIGTRSFTNFSKLSCDG